MFLKQLKWHGDNFSYTIADQGTREAVIVDAGFKTEEIKNVLIKENLKLIHIMNIFVHRFLKSIYEGKT
jgi:glyoxylase-like metal-dependent hydrolase (beta-lactamase superfamily II)